MHSVSQLSYFVPLRNEFLNYAHRLTNITLLSYIATLKFEGESPTCILDEDAQHVICVIRVPHTACEDEFRQNIRSHKQSHPVHLPPPPSAPEARKKNIYKFFTIFCCFVCLLGGLFLAVPLGVVYCTLLGLQRSLARKPTLQEQGMSKCTLGCLGMLILASMQGDQCSQK